MIIIKLGGSVITLKGEYATFNPEVMDSIGKQLANWAGKTPMIIVHGAGSFGHMKAKEYNLKDPVRDEKLPLHISEVQQDVRDLNLLIMKKLTNLGVPVTSVPPAVISELNNGKLVDFNMGIFQRLLELGTIPVVFGDVVPDKVRGVSILSGDTIMEWLTAHFHPAKTIFVLDVDGFYDKDPKENDARLYRELTVEELETILTSEDVGSKTINNVVDITGSIRGKMESALIMARLGADTYLVNGRVHGRLEDILSDRPTDLTRIIGSEIGVEDDN